MTCGRCGRPTTETFSWHSANPHIKLDVCADCNRAMRQQNNPQTDKGSEQTAEEIATSTAGGETANRQVPGTSREIPPAPRRGSESK